MNEQKRGEKYWMWADCQLTGTPLQVMLGGGACAELQARVSRESITQMFIGIYQANGHVVVEEFYPRLPDDTVDQALEWGVRRCSLLHERSATFIAPHRIARPETAGRWLTGDEADSAQRDAFRAAMQLARAEYRQAKDALLSMMKDCEVDADTRYRQCQRVQAAVNRCIALPRQYLEAVSSWARDLPPNPRFALLGQKFEERGLGVGLAGIEAR